MNVMLVLEHHFYRDSLGEYWCDRVINIEYLSRYLNVFDDLYILARVDSIKENKGGLLKASSNRINFIELPDFYGVKGLIFNYSKIRKIILKQKNNIDRIIIRMPSSLAVACYSVIKSLDKPIALEFVMAADRMFDSTKWVYNKINFFIDRYVKKICMEVNGVSYVTDYILQRQYPCKALCGQEGFTESYSSIDLTTDYFFDQEWNTKCKPGKFRIIHTGYMDDLRKGQDILILAVAELIKQNIKVELELIGDGEYRGKFEKMVDELGIRQFVKFDGQISEKREIFNKLKCSNLFVMPTHSEGLPRCIIEAMAVGLPCIASDVDGIPELLDSKWMIHDFDYVNYANKIKELLSDWNEMVKVSNRNLKIAQNYSKEKLEEKRQNFYSNLRDLK